MEAKKLQNFLNTDDRSFLYGRLLSIYTLGEYEAKQDEKYMAFSDDMFSKFIVKPHTTINLIDRRLKETTQIWEQFEIRDQKLFDIVEAEINNLKEKITSLYPDELDEPLGSNMIFGYEQEKLYYLENLRGIKGEFIPLFEVADRYKVASSTIRAYISRSQVLPEGSFYKDENFWMISKDWLDSNYEKR